MIALSQARGLAFREITTFDRETSEPDGIGEHRQTGGYD